MAISISNRGNAFLPGNKSRETTLLLNHITHDGEKRGSFEAFPGMDAKLMEVFMRFAARPCASQCISRFT